MKKILVTVLVVLWVFCLCGYIVDCALEARNDAPSMFTVVEDGDLWWVVYHNETKVMYVTSYGTFNYGNFTLLVNPDGTPMLWEAANETY